MLEGSTVAIVGAGGIGRVLIDMLAPHDVEVIAVTRSGRDGTLPVDRIDEIWGSADHFVIAAPATDATKHIVGERELAAMKPHAWIVNIARGSLIDTDALVKALEEERIGGAALDVTDPEPLPDGHPLWDSPRALITPHVANPPSTMDRDLAKRVEENVRRFARRRGAGGAGQPAERVLSSACAASWPSNPGASARPSRVTARKCAISSRSCAGMSSTSSRPLQCGSWCGTQMITSPWAAIARTSITQPGNVGCPTSTNARRGPSVSIRKPKSAG